MAINKLITSEGNVQFIFGDTGKIINVHPFHIYTTFNEDTVSFILIGLPKSSGLAIFTSKAEDLEVNGEIYSFDDLPDALADAFAIAGAQMRYEVVDELPETGQTNTIYLVPKQGGSGFDEYIYVRDTGEWELIGDTDIELARYMKKEDFNAYSAATKLKIDYISGATDYVSGAVDTEISARTSADTALQTAIDNEISARTEAISGLTDRLGEDEEVWGAALNELNASISAVNDSFSAYSTTVEMTEAITAAVSGKQATLISGTNIKTINNESILGSGNIDIQGGGVDVVQTTGTSTTDVMSQDAVTIQLNDKANKSAAVGGYKFGETSSIPYIQLKKVNTAQSLNNIYYPKINGKGILSTNSTWAINNYLFSLVETSAITTSITSSSTDSQVPSAKAVYNAIQEGSGGTVDQTIISGSTNAVAGGAVYNKIDEVEQVTAAGLNAVNDKFDGLKLKKLTQTQYDNLSTKDPSTLYIIVN